MAARVSPTETIRAEIHELFASDGELLSVLEQVARLSVRLTFQSVVEEIVCEELGRDRYQRRRRRSDDSSGFNAACTVVRTPRCIARLVPGLRKEKSSSRDRNPPRHGRPAPKFIDRKALSIAPYSPTLSAGSTDERRHGPHITQMLRLRPSSPDGRPTGPRTPRWATSLPPPYQCDH